MVSFRAHHAFDHRHHAYALEQLHLMRLFLKDLCECKALNGSFALVVGGRLDRNVCWMVAPAIFDGEEASIAMLGRAQAQEYIEQGTRRSRRRVHGRGRKVLDVVKMGFA